MFADEKEKTYVFHDTAERDILVLRDIKAHPGDSESERRKRVDAALDRRRRDFYIWACAKRMQAEYPEMSYEQAALYPQRFMYTLPKELLANVDEWVNGEPLSDIMVADLSINKILDHYNERGGQISFFDAINLINDYSHGKYANAGHALKRYYSNSAGKPPELALADESAAA